MGQPFCLEILTEELPPSEIRSTIEQLFSIFTAFFQQKQIPCLCVHPFTSARRIGVFVEDVAEQQEDYIEKKKGPAQAVALDGSGQPTRALLGFLKANGATMEDTVVEEINSVPYLFLQRRVVGKPSFNILADHLPGLIGQIAFQRPMRWGDGTFRFVRPVHNLLCLLGEQVVPFEAFGIRSNQQTEGRRFTEGPIHVPDAAQYKERLAQYDVVVDLADRTRKIEAHLMEIAASLDAHVEIDADLVWEVAALTENPAPIVGQLDKRYLSLPPEVLITTLKHHQRAFPMMRNNRPTTQWVAFADCGPAALDNARKGYERVIRARLEDALFYYKEDQKTSLEERVPQLENLLFQRGMGSTRDKVERTRAIGQEIARLLELDLPTTEKIDRACFLSKADLLTTMVYEFPELQGVMGRVYASLQGEDSVVCDALEDQYADHPVMSVPSAVVAVSDRLDVIAGNFLHSNIPSGSRDPHGLRRKMSVIMETVSAFHWDLDLSALFSFSARLYAEKASDPSSMIEAIESFAKSRLESLLVERGIRYDTIRAVLHLWNLPLRAILAARAIEQFRHDSSFSRLTVGFERVHNITRFHTQTRYDARLFEQEEERGLMQAFLEVREETTRHIRQLNYDLALESLSRMKDPIDQYFDAVFVMVEREDLRLTRLSFLKELDSLFMQVGDLTCLEEGARSDPAAGDMNE